MQTINAQSKIENVVKMQKQLLLMRVLVVVQACCIVFLTAAVIPGACKDSNAPGCFSFNYMGDPNHFRAWTKTDDSTWEEKYSDGSVATFRVLKRAKASGFGEDRELSRTGTIVRRSDKRMDVFIPDRDTDGWAAFRVGNGRWMNLSKVDFH